jgi:hypothetical protein
MKAVEGFSDPFLRMLFDKFEFFKLRTGTKTAAFDQLFTVNYTKIVSLRSE